MKKNSSTWITLAVCLIIVIAAGGFIFFSSHDSGGAALVPFAECLKAKGAQFYGAFWCPHCAAEKALFGSAVKDLPYIECSTPDMSAQTPVCNAKGIKEYPTWYFADGSSEVGVLTLQQLSDKTGCMLPDSVASSTAPADASTSSALPPESTSSSQ